MNLVIKRYPVVMAASAALDALVASVDYNFTRFSFCRVAAGKSSAKAILLRRLYSAAKSSYNFSLLSTFLSRQC